MRLILTARLFEKDIPIYINITIEIFVNAHFCTIFGKVIMAAIIGENELMNTEVLRLD